VVSVLLCVAFATRREHNHTGLSSDRFWSTKLGWSKNTDIVACGDSRVLNAVSPSVIESVLPVVNARNFGFSAAGYSAEYLEAAGRVVDPMSEQPTIILGITPHSLTPGACLRNTFIEEKNKPSARLAHGDSIDRTLFYFRPMDTKQFRRLFRVSRRSKQLTELNPDGWRAVQTDHIDRENVIEHYRSQLFENNTVKWAIVDALCQAVYDWTSEGVRVFAFRPPTCTEMETVENERSGFNEDKFVRQFEQGGGIWLDLKSSDLTCYDGSHINRQSAEKLSRRLAEAISNYGRHIDDAGNPDLIDGRFGRRITSETNRFDPEAITVK
jgi:hypothetical protein